MSGLGHRVWSGRVGFGMRRVWPNAPTPVSGACPSSALVGGRTQDPERTLTNPPELRPKPESPLRARGKWEGSLRQGGRDYSSLTSS
eukprot:gene22290-biopygen8749